MHVLGIDLLMLPDILTIILKIYFKTLRRYFLLIGNVFHIILTVFHIVHAHQFKLIGEYVKTVSQHLIWLVFV